MKTQLLTQKLIAGAPVDLTPLRDDPVLGKSVSDNNAFRYDPLRQDRCPFAAHTRKTNPRSDLDAFGGTESAASSVVASNSDRKSHPKRQPLNRAQPIPSSNEDSFLCLIKAIFLMASSFCSKVCYHDAPFLRI